MIVFKCLWFVGQFLIKGMSPNSAGDTSKVKVKLRMNANGCIALQSASMIEKLPTPPSSPSQAECTEPPASPHVDDQDRTVSGCSLSVV